MKVIATGSGVGAYNVNAVIISDTGDRAGAHTVLTLEVPTMANEARCTVESAPLGGLIVRIETLGRLERDAILEALSSAIDAFRCKSKTPGASAGRGCR